MLLNILKLLFRMMQNTLCRVFCSTIHSSNDCKNETVNCIGRNLGQSVTHHTVSGRKEEVSSVHQKNIFPSVSSSLCVHSELRRQQSCLLHRRTVDIV